MSWTVQGSKGQEIFLFSITFQTVSVDAYSPTHQFNGDEDLLEGGEFGKAPGAWSLPLMSI
jgi:hypothetical protein